MAGAGLRRQGRDGHLPLTPQGEQPSCPWHGTRKWHEKQWLQQSAKPHYETLTECCTSMVI